MTSIFALFILIWFGLSIGKEQDDWKRAGDITHYTLGYFKVEQSNLPVGQTLYFINRPIKYKNAWVFPVGLVDGLWFIYRDNTLVVNDVPSVEKARSIAGQGYPYIFSFDINDEIHQEK